MATIVQFREPTPYARQLVSALCPLDAPRLPGTQEEIAQWRLNLQRLTAQGPDAVGAIREFLRMNVDLDFNPRTALGYRSARAAMFDALAQIGGAEGVAATLQTLQETADPREIALLTQSLEKLAPGLYRQEALAAAREALAMAATGKLPDADVAPLFEVLHACGDNSVVVDLMQAAKQWNYYSAIGLAELPNGAGIPALIEMAKGPSGGRLNALEMLAQVAVRYDEARAALLEQARTHQISSRMWPYLVPLLAGDVYHYHDSSFESTQTGNEQRSNAAHVRTGNQNIFTAPKTDVLTAEEINQRLALIDELQAGTADPAALRALERSRELLRSRHPQTLAVSP